MSPAQERAMTKRVLIVGAGFYGSVCAYELARRGCRVHVIEKRDHIGGNCYTRYCPEAECHEHVYGAHIFHTNAPKIWSYINQFCAFNHYVNRVKVRIRDDLYSFPINLFTLYQVFGTKTPEEARARLETERVPIAEPENLEDYCLSVVGRRIYEMFIEGYTAKQWNRHPRELGADIIKRIPIRFTFDDNYFNDRFQGIPVGGYTAIFDKLLAGIRVDLNVDFNADREHWLSSHDLVIYTGPIDAFFDYAEGALEYRSLRFERELLDIPDFQGSAVVNYTQREVPYTRILEHKHFDLSYAGKKTLITREFPDDWGVDKIAYYPVNAGESQKRFARYRKRADALDGKVHFGGRLGEFRYYDMHQVIGAALAYLNELVT
jgi:UDP-galactopyranose mutase